MIRLVLALVMVAHAGRWSRWCERNLVADDPYQFETYTVDELVDAWWAVRPPPRVLADEMVRRLVRGVGDEDREILVKTLENR